MTNQFQTIIYETDGPIAKITLNRPEKLNAINAQMAGELRVAFNEVNGDPAVRVLVLTGAGRAFSSGADVGAWPDRQRAREEEAKKRGKVALPTPTAASPQPRDLEHIVEKPVLASINGVCAGAGYGLALASDIRIASTNARFSHVYMRRALVTSCEVWFLPRLLGLGPALYHILMRDDMSVQEAERWGLVCKVVPPEDLERETRIIAEHLAAGPPTAMKFSKRAVYKGLLTDLDSTMEYVGYCRALNAVSGEWQEGTAAFLEKRRPVY